MSPAASDPRHAYESWHQRLEREGEIETPWYRLVRARLTPDALRGRRVLEIGCGQGGFALWLRDQIGPDGWLVAADFAMSAVSRGAARAARVDGRPIHWIVADIQAIPHRSSSFDLVISSETIEHVARPADALRELAGVLRPGGQLILTFPNYLGPLGVYRGYLRLRGRRFTEVGQPVNRFLLSPAVKRWVRRAGLRLQTIDGVGHYLPFPGRRPIRIQSLDRWKRCSRWTGHHAMIVAEKA
jgi:SAM-dependent methyltransferase